MLAALRLLRLSSLPGTPHQRTQHAGQGDQVEKEEKGPPAAGHRTARVDARATGEAVVELRYGVVNLNSADFR